MAVKPLKRPAGRDIVVHHRRTQFDSLVGVLVAKGDGLVLPLNRKLITMIHELETGARSMRWDNLDDLANG